MDNSFFCIRSYNHLDNEFKDCLRCVGNPDKREEDCIPAPVRYTVDENVTYLKELKKHFKKIEFLVQNQSQSLLLRKHFGEDVIYKVVGMNTGEINIHEFDGSPFRSGPKKYDFVFHGSCSYAKGIYYFLELARHLPGYTFMVPENKNEVEKLLRRKLETNNVSFLNCSWENGLRELVENCNVVINPSLWSSVIEGALLKSIAFNGNVAVVKCDFGFTNEIPQDCLIRLGSDVAESAQVLSDFVINNRDYSIRSREWLKSFMMKNDANKIFQ
jgi:hypothetical protein